MVAVAYPRLWRAVAAVLSTVSRVSLVVIVGLVLWATDPPVTPPLLVELVVNFSLLPGVAAGAVARAFAATLTIEDEALVIRRRGVRMEIAGRALAAVRPWRLPLPRAGVAFGLTSGRALGTTLAPSDLATLLDDLAALGVDEARQARSHPTVVYASARRAVAPTRWYHVLGRFVLFALFPAGVLFNAHQHIAYGGPLGEYHLLGLASYLRTFAVYWSTCAIYLVLYANVLRVGTEVASLASAWVVPAAAPRVRRVAEVVSRVVYYGGVPAVLLLRFAPWS